MGHRSILLVSLLGLTTAIPSAAQPVPAVFDLAATTITYERDEGYCPDCSRYTITLRGDGTGTFAGRRESTPLGPVSFAVSPDSVLVQLNALSHCGFFEAGDRVPTPQTFGQFLDSIHSDLGMLVCDHDWAKITVEIASFTKAVQGGARGPCSIGACGARIDALVRSQQWLLGTKAQARPVVARCSDSTRICMFNEAGGIERLPISLQVGGHGALGRGDSGPTVSPDGRWIAYSRFYDLFLFDVLERRESQLTNFNLANWDSIGCETFITQWSFDSKRLLYCVSEPWRRGESKARSRDCPVRGFFVYDLGSGSAKPIVIPGGENNYAPGPVECWLPDGRVLLSLMGIEDTPLEFFEPSDATKELIGSVKGGSQGRCSPDGQRIILRQSPAPSESQIVEIEVRDGALMPVSPIGGWTQYQSPSYSPSGNHRAFLEDLGRDEQTLEDANGQTRLIQTFHRAIWVDQARIASHANINRYSWCGNEAIAFSTDDSLFVVAVDGRMLARHGFTIAKTP